jgi:hypothetical protein
VRIVTVGRLQICSIIRLPNYRVCAHIRLKDVTFVSSLSNASGLRMTRFSWDPLYIYVGLAIATLGGLVAISHERWDHLPKSAEQVERKVETAAPVQPKPATPEATTPAPSAAAPGGSTPAVATGSPEVKPAEPAQTAGTPATAAPAQPLPEAKSPSPQKSALEQEPATTSQPDAQPSKIE